MSSVVATELPKRPNPTTSTLLVLFAMILRVSLSTVCSVKSKYMDGLRQPTTICSVG